MFYYKLSTSKSIKKDEVLTFFNGYIIDEQCHKNKEAYVCSDGSMIIFHNSEQKEFVYVEFHCKLTPIPNRRVVSCKGLRWFCTFCSENNSQIKILRNNTVIPPSSGALFSDLKRSKSFKDALHLATHPEQTKTYSKPGRLG